MASNQSPKYSKWHKSRELIQIWGLIIPGCAGILISIASVFLSPQNLVLNFLLFLFSILALAIGLERYDAIGEEKRETQHRHEVVIETINLLQQMVEQNNQALMKEVAHLLQTLIATTVTAKPLIGNKAIYEESARVIKACKGSEIIRATSFFHHPIHPEDIPVSREYFEVLAKVVGQAKRKKLGMFYKVVMGFSLNDKDEPPLEGQDYVRKRRELFKQNNALDRMELRYIGGSWSLNFLIVGQEQMFIGFPTIAKDANMRAGMLIIHKDFVENAIRWYDELLWGEAKVVNWTGGDIQP